MKPHPNFRISFITSFLFLVVILSIKSGFGQSSADIFSLEATFTDPFDFRSFVIRLDSNIIKVQSDSNIDEETYESSVQEYFRWKSFWNNRVAYDPHLNKLNCNRAYQLISRYANQPLNLTNTSSLNPICDGSVAYPSHWMTLGPLSYSTQNIGFIQSVAVDPSNINTLFAGSENGGLYKSVDGGINWVNKTNYLRIPGLGINDIYVDPVNSNNVWVATGSNKGYGVGIIKSTDNGNTWFIYPTNLTPENFYAARIKVDPTNHNFIWFTKASSLYRIDETNASNPITTLVYTVDPGPFWYQRQLIDIELIPINGGSSTRILVGSLDVNSWNGGATIFYNDNGGNVGPWTELTPEPNIERVNMDFSSSTPNKFYCIYNKQNGYPLRISEISHDQTLPGNQSSYPTYMVGAGAQNDFIEITNFGTGTLTNVDISNICVERWNNTGRDYISSINPHIVNITSGQTIILAFGSGTDDVSNGFYYLRNGSTADERGSSDQVGYVLKYTNSGGSDVILDAVGLNGIQFPYLSRISSLHWNTNLSLSMTGSSGVFLSSDDNNSPSCWTTASAAFPTNFEFII